MKAWARQPYHDTQAISRAENRTGAAPHRADETMCPPGPSAKHGASARMLRDTPQKPSERASPNLHTCVSLAKQRMGHRLRQVCAKRANHLAGQQGTTGSEVCQMLHRQVRGIAPASFQEEGTRRHIPNSNAFFACQHAQNIHLLPHAATFFAPPIRPSPKRIDESGWGV